MTEPPQAPLGGEPDAASTWPASQPGDAVPAENSPPAPTAARRTSAIGVLGALVVLTLVAGVLLYVLDGGTSASASAAVSDAAADSAAGGTAQVAVVGSVGTGGASASFSAKGGVDFTNGASELTVGASAAGHQITTKVVFVNGTAYVNEPQLATLVPGKQWISVDLSALTGAGGTNGIDPVDNPAGWLQMLTAGGGTVTTLGPSTVGGTPVQGYSVKLTPSAIAQNLSSAKLPSWLKTMLSKVTFGDVTFKVYVDDSGLLRRVTVDTQVSAASSGPVQIHESITYSHYGTPVNVTAPTPNEVVTLQQAIGSLAHGLTPAV